MATKVHMEALSPTMEEGQVVKWLRSEGDTVANGDIIAEIETDKATMELTARGDGTLLKIFVGEGGVAPVGEVIAVIGEADEDISGIEGPSGGSSPAPVPAEAPSAPADDGAGPPPSVAPSVPDPAEVAATPGGRVKASPLARRLAEEAGIALASIAGSGPGGRIVKRDVEAARASVAAPSSSAVHPAPAAVPTAPAWSGARLGDAIDGHEDIPLTQMRKTIARRLVESIGPIPHFFLTIEVDMGRVLEARRSVNAFLESRGVKVSVNDFVLKATAAALRQHPAVNAAWHGDYIRRFDAVHLGVAVAVEDGLMTPVIRNADSRGMVEISQELRELAGRAREKRLQPDEYTGATFSVSNLGMFGIKEFTAVINPPEAGILAVGRVEETAVVEGGQVVVRPRMKVTMSCDHRVIDGATGAQFLQTFKAILEEPAAVSL